MNEQEPLDLSVITKDDFTPLIDSEFVFEVEGESEDINLKLLEVSEYPDHRPEDQRKGRKPFALVLGCATHGLEQGTYSLKHKDLGLLFVFLSPFENYEKGHKLEAVFS